MVTTEHSDLRAAAAKTLVHYFRRVDPTGTARFDDSDCAAEIRGIVDDIFDGVLEEVRTNVLKDLALIRDEVLTQIAQGVDVDDVADEQESKGIAGDARGSMKPGSWDDAVKESREKSAEERRQRDEGGE